MTKKNIQTAQDYLTISKENGKKRIMDIEQLLKKHPSEEVTNLLKVFLREKQTALRDFILEDKTKKEVDETVGVMFRVTMAIKAIEGEKEVKEFGRAK